MEFIIREMQTGEAKLLQKNGSSAFLHSLEAPFMPKPKDALVAELNGEVVGCFSYSIKNYERKKVGYCDYLYVDAAHAGKGIASKLCEEGVNHLWTQGCDYLTASVRDDNVGSWTAFEKHGFVRAKTPKMISAIGLAGYLSLSISSLQGIAGYSCDFFIAAAAAQPHSADDMHSKLMHTSRSHEQFSMQQKEGGFGQLLLHLLTNFGLLMIPVIVGIIFSNLDFSYFFTNNFLAFLISSLIVLGGVIFFSFLGTLLSKRSWSYRMA
ncbi:MAG: GNAT family N-acetyltransferase, partial [Defluviitaleaceae bacterium]|nr:GNAT family N-acetyltransferase [Defluviitaleaceae bacterium]